MKLVLLPGMDGTGNLFFPLLAALSSFDCEVISLPQTGPQDYPFLTEYVRGKLPEKDFVLIAESFSGPIAVALSKERNGHLKGVIFVATFLSAPNKLLITIARFLPLKLLSRLPFTRYFYKLLFLGRDANVELIKLFQSPVNTLSSPLIKARLSVMQTLTYRPEAIELPIVYIQAVSDRLVSPEKAIEFASNFNHIMIEPLEGPHFILQAKPAECAAAISKLESFFEIKVAE